MWPWGRRNENEPLGRRGERLAARLLRRSKLKILARNYRCDAGEADLVALDPRTPDGDTLVFVEVKTRSSDYFTDPESAVDARKQRRYRDIARCYLREIGRGDLPVRFDVVSILIQPGEKPELRHIVGAFG